MPTLSEIQSAVSVLPNEEKAQLLRFIATQLRTEGALAEPRLYSRAQIDAWIKADEEGMRQFLAGEDTIDDAEFESRLASFQAKQNPLP
jgi:hypothetical protein